MEKEKARAMAQDVEDNVYIIIIGNALESKLAREFLESKGLLEEWDNYCHERYDETMEYLHSLFVKMKGEHTIKKELKGKTRR